MANIQRTQVLVVIIISLLSRISLLQAETIASDVHSNISTLKSIVRITNRLGDGSTLNLHYGPCRFNFQHNEATNAFDICYYWIGDPKQ
ncbi:unnamed protein product [Brassica napus]|uniref:(rape) hypothetical protein n=1 Tax=Brassica napus TaxID=3708 RepID=A0A816HZA4_BRANA|nr:unnamed protein product [Brassica napus]